MSYGPDDLTQANRHVAQGERFVEFQQKLVAVKRERGQPFALADRCLEIFEAGLSKHRIERDALVENIRAHFRAP